MSLEQEDVLAASFVGERCSQLPARNHMWWRSRQYYQHQIWRHANVKGWLESPSSAHLLSADLLIEMKFP
jgi:hypothetical protein